LHQINAFLPGVAAYLSEPKQQAFFDGPIKPLNPNAFLKKLAQNELKPSPQTRILSLGKSVYCNGDDVTKTKRLRLPPHGESYLRRKYLRPKN